MKPKRIIVLILAGLFLFLTLYTWNLRTGNLDALSTFSGLEVTAQALRPGKWLARKVSEAWDRYVSLAGLKQENDKLAAENNALKLENMMLRDRTLAVQRLEELLHFSPPSEWSAMGGRVITHRLGPVGVLDSIVVDKGKFSGIGQDTPVIVPQGVVGRVLRSSLTASTILLLSDPNSDIPVLSEKSRTPGILSGQGLGSYLELRFVDINAPIQEGELLITSGLAGIFPKGLPAARVTAVERSGHSLFLSVAAEPLVSFDGLEELLLLNRNRIGPTRQSEE